MAGQRTRIVGWCEPSACCRKHDGTQLTGPLTVVSSKIGWPTGRANRLRTRSTRSMGAETSSRRRWPRPDLRVSYDQVGDRPTRNCPGSGARTGRLTCPNATDRPPHPGWRSTPPSTSRRMTRGRNVVGRRFKVGTPTRRFGKELVTTPASQTSLPPSTSAPSQRARSAEEEAQRRPVKPGRGDRR